MLQRPRDVNDVIECVLFPQMFLVRLPMHDDMLRRVGMSTLLPGAMGRSAAHHQQAWKEPKSMPGVVLFMCR